MAVADVSQARAPFASPADRAHCRALIKVGSRSFHAASRVLPDRVREPAFALYAFCRLADDSVDETADGVAARHRALARLHQRLDAAYAGRPWDMAVDRAFADMVARFDMPKALPEALLDGLRWDAEGRAYQILQDLYAYGARVAGAVGAMMTVLMGRRDAETLARACDLGVAMQLTNIARDVGEDARAGRVYLPRDWLREAGIDVEDFVARPRFSPALAGVVRRLLDAADVLYARSEVGVARLPGDCRVAIMAARLIYAEIGAAVAASGYDSVSRRAVVSAGRKAALLARASATLWRRPAALTASAGAPPLAQTRFLVEAAADQTAAANANTARPKARSLDESIGWVIDLCAALEARDRGRAPQSGLQRAPRGS